MTPNPAAPGNGAIAVLFHLEHHRRAVPEQQCWAVALCGLPLS